LSYLDATAVISDFRGLPALKWGTFPELLSEDAVLTQISVGTLKEHMDGITDDFLATLPPAESLSPAERRGIIARYSAVLEGNFIYWMTGALLAAKSNAVREILIENLHDEVRDSHPEMMRRFASAAGAAPTDTDAEAVSPLLSKVRLFIGRLSAPPSLAMMAFFEGLIQRFMPYLADLAVRQSSSELDYTDVHGVCDIHHTQELYRALEMEMALSDSPVSTQGVFEGVFLLRELLRAIIFHPGVDGVERSA
jgi:hypothetical protein